MTFTPLFQPRAGKVHTDVQERFEAIERQMQIMADQIAGLSARVFRSEMKGKDE